MIRILNRLFYASGLLVYFLWELVVANFRLARDVLRPLPRLRPAIVAVPLSLERDTQIVLLANLITLTPGTLSLDVSSDRRFLYVHVMHVEDVAAFREEVKSGFERRIRRLLG
ncbi:MAG: Na+/H+ antiporter subunit E [Bryobacterales bacterium]|nr:Na+/H+ antiporter subunit E [Bryobacteraceae bacterium]MDW8356056.1 Na+/H+ antiporter subunit E [Bryobacterales bacterium]